MSNDISSGATETEVDLPLASVQPAVSEIECPPSDVLEDRVETAPPLPEVAPIEVANVEPDLDPSCERPYLGGVHYLDFLVALEKALDASLYLEVGTESGASLRRISCASIAIDPHFNLSADSVGSKPACHFFQMSSDAFFKKINFERLFDDRVSLAFLDGMHRFEFLLRDFMNTEKLCERGSAIVMHDCFPINLEMALRVWIPADDRQSPRRDVANWWTGDVWKLLPILRKYRPDVQMIRVDCPPTGLLICTNLDPASRVLEEKYFEILAEFSAMELSDFGLGRLFEEFPLEDSHGLLNQVNLTARLWA